MKLARRFQSTLMLLLMGLAANLSAQRPLARKAPLRQVGSVPLPGISGDFDHFALDRRGGRLFLAGEDHKTLEVFDMNTGNHLKSIAGFGTPHSILYQLESDRILVTDSDQGLVTLRGSDYRLLGKTAGLEGADSARLDPKGQILYIVTGGKDAHLDHSFLVALDLETGKKTGEVKFDSNHVEALALDPASDRLFINVTSSGEVAVIDRRAMKEILRWPVGVAGENSPMVYDQAHRRLLIVCRKPPALVVMDTDSGRVVADLAAAGRADDIAYDPASGRIYVPGGEGYVSVFRQESADKYLLLATVPTAPGAKTSLLVPELKRYFIAASPGETKALAKLLIFQILP